MKKKIIFSLISLIILITIYLSIFVIKEEEQGIKLNYNKIINKEEKNTIYNPGIYFKIPFIEYVKKNNTLIQITNGNINNINNDKNKYDISINFHIKWKIINPYNYYKNTKKNEKQILDLIKFKLKKNILNKINKIKFKKNNNKKNKLYCIKIIKQIEIIKKINSKTLKSEIDIFNKKNIKHYKNLGIKIINVKINKIEFTKKIYNLIYKNMEINQKKLIKNENISGKIKAIKIKSYENNQTIKKLYEAKKKAILIKNEGEIQANKIIIKNIKKDPEFYYFIRSLKAYKNILNKNKTNIIILDINTDFLKYMKKKY
ncbi:protease modulator HflC [Candidatus Purcelliella pentastirinorum]|uniref:protease modulator HflC n=1 Tax=Candidatus Purcelliella pentastirinorum TaxID=472834 RepID=UPI002367B87A|nr:protease modulator HflC [Candidatus Purcelliella pentastirinorum]WDI78792.1 protease modulator HflC [Candidatus Purcelliella pentastirinorum]WDR79925.1 protease modulator HflC [Candidatus Purcelliella pentastirinorum]